MLRTFRASPADETRARRALEIHGRLPHDPRSLVAFLADGDCHLIIAVEEREDGEEHEDVVGSLRGHALHTPHRAEPQFLLYEIDVRPDRRGRGVGRGLVSEFVHQARKAGAFEIWTLTTDANAAALALYRRCGFVRPNVDDVMLRLQVGIRTAP